ncbi:hypothetical protein B0A55_05890 [Friedmanniomyces simplex]|uniref:AMP-dependent synthetase/ligase domain-containing protein n=1 Tax=Friedmanniomyces simplex TaxID=329884 RepID=A0A4U0XGI0_9PEZI|nr:hypothetical protein B0A55_05890 [Friedmanniomyces simplex]
MALPALAVAGGAAAAAYLDAKLHVRHDLAAGVLTDPVARAQEYVAQRQGQRRMLIYHLLEDNVLSNRSGNLFLEYEGRSWTYKQFYDSVQRVGNWLMNDIGVRQGEMVALNGLNSAEYLFLWFALEGIGARIAFTNCHLTDKTFWPEVCESKANRLQYVGELCRYLVNAPPHPLERKHNVQEAWGNGMRPDVWNTFRQRFNIAAIHELYAATDGMGSSFNRNLGDFSSGAIGVRGYLWHLKRGANEVRAKIDPDTEDIVRASNGFVVRANVGEPGEVLHRVDPAMAESAFKGYYNNPGASQKRWLRGVFEPDDLFFRSGDVMRVDGDGRVYFVDRLGDTFRWKSENVSTNEVADILGQFDQIAECNVYGVSVPHADGRCGCATIVPTTSISLESFDFARLYTHVAGRLPRYAVPLFLRVAPELSYTGTFKIQKGQAKREGVDLDLIEQAGSKDRLYWLPPGGSAYVPFRREDWQALKAGDVKL